MSQAQKTIMEAFQETTYQVVGHGKRELQVLKQALDAFEGSVGSDIYGSGPLIENFQAKMANYLGTESAVFFPSGTMAQQVALRIWCDQKGLKRVAYHPLCHLEIHEEDGLKELHHIEPILLGEADRVIRLADVQNLPAEIACLLLELPQREIGGQLPPYEELEAISAYCRKQGIKLHLDGARLYEILPYYQKTAAEVCALFDSVYVSFYKGIGGVAGAILAGSEAFTKEAKVWKRRHGGDLISLYPYILSADYYFDEKIDRMARYYEEAQELAGMFNQCAGVTTLPEVPVSNMFHVHFQVAKEQMEPILSAIYEATGIGLTPALRSAGENSCFYEVSIGDRYGKIPKPELQQLFHMLNERIKGLV